MRRASADHSSGRTPVRIKASDAHPDPHRHARQFFSRGGTLSKWHPNYEFRPGQVEMAEAVEAALADKRHLIVEAGTGTGKTLAYLVPALLSGKRIVVSTGTKNLQEQLFFKDVPFLQQHFPRPLKVCYMKGRDNYACRQKIYDAEKEPVLTGLEEVADFQIIREWEKTTEFGDRAEIKTLPESSTAWAKIDARSDLCTGQKCPNFERCFITLMHQRAAESDIIIVNHHLFFADLSLQGRELRGRHPARVSRRGVRRSARNRGRRRASISASRSATTASRNCGATSPRRRPHEEVRHAGTGPHPRAPGRAHRCTSSRSSARSNGASAFTGRDAFREDNEEAYSDLLAALELIGSHLQADAEPAGGDHARCSAARRS